MLPDPYLPEEDTPTNCTWCGGKLGQSPLPAHSAIVFCSHQCEIEGNLWLYQEMCVIEFNKPGQSANDHYDSP